MADEIDRVREVVPLEIVRYEPPGRALQPDAGATPPHQVGGRRRRPMHADRFTIKSREAIAAAQARGREAQSAGEHQPPAGRPARAGGRLVVPVLGARTPTRRRCAGGPDAVDMLPTVTGDARRARFDAEFAEALGRADEEADKLGDQYIPTEDLLLALADDRNTEVGAARDALPDAVKACAARTP